jgi:orotate phosphoribosyltransferase
MVDDVMSAGSALRGTHAALQAHGATPVAAGALLILGATGADFFTGRGLPVEAVVRDRHTLWNPAECPLCAAGEALESAADAA